MLSWFFIFIPIVVTSIILIFFLHKVVWWEVLLLILPSALIILLLNTIMVSYNTSDTEYVGSYITNVNYYEPWDERVSCRHPIYCTRTYKCGKSMCTSTYVCGHVHAYDVDYHPEEWTKEDNFGEEYQISIQEYNELNRRFDTDKYFIELNRDYHSIDGDKFSTDWAGQQNRSSVMSDEHSYENKIRASHSVFKFQDITEKEQKRWKLYDYPNVYEGYQPIVLGKSITKLTDRKLQYLNGYYGPVKQFKIFILVFKDQPMSVVHKQRSYWEGGNKNEFVVCIGVDKSNKFQWVDCFSWMDKPSLEVEVEHYFNKTEDTKFSKFADWMPKQIEQHWKRKDFKDFKYLQIELTDTQLWWVMIIIMIYNIAVSIWVVNNEVENKFIPSSVTDTIDGTFSKTKNFFIKLKLKFLYYFNIFVDKIKKLILKDEEKI